MVFGIHVQIMFMCSHYIFTNRKVKTILMFYIYRYIKNLSGCTNMHIHTTFLRLKRCGGRVIRDNILNLVTLSI